MQPIAPPLPNRRDAVFRRLLAVADCFAAAGGLLLANIVNHQRLSAPSFATLPVIVLINKLAGRYDHDEVVVRKSTLDEAPILAAVAAAYALVWSVVTLAFNEHSSRGAVLVLWAGTSACLIALRALARGFAQRLAPPERALVIGEPHDRESLGRRLAVDTKAAVEIVGYLALEDDRRAGNSHTHSGPRNGVLSVSALKTAVESLRAHRVILIPPNYESDAVFEAVASAHSAGMKVSIVPSLFEVFGSAVEFDEFGGFTALGLRRPGLSRSSVLIKRATDIIGAMVGLIVVAPLWLLAAIAIKLDSPGPVFFRQPRVGRGGRRFEMIKFRSMVASAEEQRSDLESLNETDGIFKIANDPRVTRVGRRLRKSSLDELPQLINVLRGEMSLVGPRPLLPEEDQRVEGHHRKRLQLAPGMTGPWQVLGPQRPPLSEMVKIDYLYAANWSLWSDVKYILRTVIHVLGRRGV
ncbi:MAG: sugar transferase [Solirubrobacterales bacterium]|nr:sugar transferase [Solirubrobacterales bacterium]